MRIETIEVGDKFENGVTQIEVVKISIRRLFASEEQKPCVTDVCMMLQRFAVVSRMGTTPNGKPFDVDYGTFMRQIQDWKKVGS